MSVRKVLCRLDEIPDGGAIAAAVESSTGGFSLILLRQGQHVFAYHNECPHAGRRLDWSPGKFLIENGQLICAAHGASFFIESGRCFAGPCLGSGLAAVKVEVAEGEVRLP
ncbi:MAG TPA: Rieske 2Fe-2S domain-containing protein [Rudaea sp.]|nr:Rieske 2Fe-2S domain-containing protein [Rudaea sp.]